MSEIRGVLTAMVTPFTKDGALDIDASRRLARHLVENGSHGVVVAGTTGESPTLEDDEKLALLEAVNEEIGAEATVIVGTGSNDTRHSCKLTERACAAGADGVLAVTPYYNKPNERGLRAHFRAVAEAAGETPVVLYNIPSRTVINVPPGLLAEIAAESPNVVAVKQANNDDLGPIEGLEILAGNDEVFARTLAFGGAGGILVSSHVIGREMRAIYDAAMDGEMEKAQELDAALRPVYEAMTVTSNPTPVKTALELLGVLEANYRLPMVPATDEERERIRGALAEHGAALAEGSAGRALSDSVRILPLGGLGEIGKNMTVVEQDGRLVIVDTGLMFPTAEMLGIDLVLPDFSYLRGRIDDIEAIFLTHGHEDHVGALPYVLREIGIPPAIYGGPLTIGLVRSKLEEHRIKDAPLEVVDTGERIKAGPFEAEMIHMSHSIPDARAVALHTSRGAILVTGDYRFDQTPVDGRPADVARLAELGSEGVLCLCGDSTNADRPGVVPSEATVGPALRDVFTRCAGRIIVTCFASNVHRVQQVVDAAAALDRKVALVGRSMRKNFNIARNLGIASAPDGMMIQPKEIESFPDEKVVVISTGSQGEPLSALRRMAYRDHRDVELHSGDTVIFSATPIPGNERSVNETIDKIYKIGASVVTTADAPIHVSGHGSREELKLMLNLTRPQHVFPFHGDFKRIQLHAELAEAVGIEPERIHKGRNGLPLEIDSRGARFGEPRQAGMIFVDGVDIGDPDDVALRDRRMLSADGIFIVVATIDSESGESVAAPEIIFRGVPFLEGGEVDGLVGELRDVVEDSLAHAAREGVTEPVLLQEDLHDDVAQFVYDRLRRRPMILPVVVEV